jgi:hypothetical protein
MLSNGNAPNPAPMIVRATEAGKRLRLKTPLPMNGKELPTLIKVKASMFVATGNMGFDAQGDHNGNCDQRGAASHDADHAREEEHSD